ncbi:MAG: hypothetical protein K2M03_04635, partial [Muribaculaceae bacterium]|nr:hypothetical protein [Muribaculaceae bacterium]
MNAKKSNNTLSSFVTTEKTPLAGAGSSRRYYRQSGYANGSLETSSVVVTEGDNPTENRTFIGLSKFFADRGVNVPRILEVSDDGLCYVQQDLGDTSLLDVIRSGDTEKISSTVRKAIDELIKMQTVNMEELSREAQQGEFEILPEFDRTAIQW